jgi:hypothetical protein
MSHLDGKFVVAVISNDETRIWETNASKGTHPDTVKRPGEEKIHAHTRTGESHGGHGTHRMDNQYYDGIAHALADAGEVLIMGHGKGRGNAMLQFIQYLERHHSPVAQKVVGQMEVNVPAMTEPQILAAAREWFDHRWIRD